MIHMKKQDIEELSQLLRLYENTYRSKDAERLLEEIATLYKEQYGKSIFDAKNPRNAGRKKKYTENERKQVLKCRSEGMTIREIARKTGMSVGNVQKLISEYFAN